MQDLAQQAFRLSPQQKQTWNSQQRFVAGPLCVVVQLAITGRLDEIVLRNAIERIARRYEILRTQFKLFPGFKIPFQVISSEAHYSWEMVDLSRLDGIEQIERIEQCFDNHRQRAFDFAEGPLLRVALLNLSASQQVLVASMPAMIADFKTLESFTRELIQEYKAGAPVEDAEATQYADYAQWQLEQLEAADAEAIQGRAHWQKQTSAPTKLPLERERPQPDVLKISSVPLEHDVAELQSLASQQSVSLRSILFGAWQAVLARLVGADEFSIQTLCQGRNLDDFRNALGPYSRYVSVQCGTSEESIAQHLRSVSDKLARADLMQDYFDPNTLPIAAEDSVLFEFVDWTADCESAELSVSLERYHVRLAPFKLNFSCALVGNRLIAKLLYDEETIDHQAAKRIAGYIQKFLAELPRLCAAPANSGPLTRAVEILGDEEKQRLLVDFNNTRAEYAHDQCIHVLFERQAELTPDAPALVHEDNQLSYRELNQQANQLAHFLLSQRGSEVPIVAICMDRSADMIVALLGILKSGAAYLPLNHEHPLARLQHQLVESKASFCITNDQRLLVRTGFSGVVDVNAQRGPIRAEPTSNPNVAVDAQNLAYIMYTSGSTGTPKGIGVTHRNLVNYSQFIVGQLADSRARQFAMVSTLSADLGNTCLFPALISGGCLHVLGFEMAIQAGLLSKYLTERPIDVLKIVPSHLQALLAASDGNVLPARYLILGGEPLSQDLLKMIYAVPHQCRIMNHYGPTETTVGSLTYPIGDADPVIRPTVPIGRPIANTQVYVLTQDLTPAPTGAPGELYIGGDGVALGYWNQPTQTAERFLPDPFAKKAGARFYRTGDLVRHLPNGTIEFIGRRDNQVKLRGFRVEIGEIEAVLLQHPTVSQVVVVPRTDDAVLRLVAYLVGSNISSQPQEEIFAFLKDKLPEYMLPAALVYLKSFPLTANGKIDRAALPAPDKARYATRTAFIAASTDLERKLVSLWTELLKLDEIGINDNFFEIGGHSLLATQLISRIRKTFGKDIPLRTVFEAPDIAQLAARIETFSSDSELAMLQKLEAVESLSEEEALQLLEPESNSELKD